MCLTLGQSWEGFAPLQVLLLVSSWEDFQRCAEQVFFLELLIRLFSFALVCLWFFFIRTARH